MFGWGKPKKSPFGIPYPLIFKDAEAAVEYSSEFMICKLRPGVELPAVVLDARRVVGSGDPVWRREDGIQTALIKVAGEDGGFRCFAQTSGALGPRLVPGEMVLWKAFKLQPSMGEALGDTRSGWLGLIVGTLVPELVAEGWKGLGRFSER